MYTYNNIVFIRNVCFAFQTIYSLNYIIHATQYLTGWFLVLISYLIQVRESH